MNAIEIMMSICKQCAHRDHCHRICPYVWLEIMDTERKEE